jgi:hypothetical protein
VIQKWGAGKELQRKDLHKMPHSWSTDTEGSPPLIART